MNDQKVLFFALLVCIYFLYSVHLWFTSGDSSKDIKNTENIINPLAQVQPVEVLLNNEIKAKKPIGKRKPIPLFLRNACSITEVFTLKPTKKCKQAKQKNMESGSSSVTVLGITIFLLVLTVNAVLDVIKVKEEERARRKLNPEGERRQSLAEFANKNKKPLRRESSKIGSQLIDIQENIRTVENPTDNKTFRKLTPYTRGNSTNSYNLDRHEVQDENVTSTAMGDSSQENQLVKRQSASKLTSSRMQKPRSAPERGTNPRSSIQNWGLSRVSSGANTNQSPTFGRRSSFPALHICPDVQSAMLGHRQNSTDSDDDSKGRRVRIIKRF